MSNATPTRPAVDARAAWTLGAGRLIGRGIGIMFVVLGAVALLRTGLPTTMAEFTAEHVTVGWLDHTVLLALIHVAIGASIVSAVSWFSAGYQAMSSGIVLAVVGLVLWIEPDGLHDSLATHAGHGITYIVAGLGLALAGWLISFSTPVVTRVVRS